MERIEGRRFEMLSHHKVIEYYPRYDSGYLENWKEQMGESPLSWFIPFYNEKKQESFYQGDVLSQIHVE